MNRALLVVDLQNDYFPGGKMELVGIEEAAKNVAQLLAIFRAQTMPILHVQHLSISPEATFFLPDTNGVKIHQSVAPKEGERVIKKHFPNSFRETALYEELQDRHIGEVIVCGAMSHMCIDSTVRAGFDLGLSCVVVADGCAARDLAYGDQIIAAVHVHGAYMAGLAAAFAKVTDMHGLKMMLDPAI